MNPLIGLILLVFVYVLLIVLYNLLDDSEWPT